MNKHREPNFLKIHYYSIKNLFPIRDSKKEEKLNDLKEMKNYYSQKIGEKTGIFLENIEIKFLDDYLKDLAYDSVIEELKIIDKKNLSLNKKLIKSFGVINSLPSNYVALKILEPFIYFSMDAAYLPKSNKIIFNDNYFSRIGEDMGIKKDETMMHELSHALWENINPNDNSTEENYFYWSEGFAVYGEKNYFSELLLPDSTKTENTNKKYIKGKKLVDKVIEKYGEKSFLKIPLCWEKFDKEFNQ